MEKTLKVYINKDELIFYIQNNNQIKKLKYNYVDFILDFLYWDINKFEKLFLDASDVVKKINSENISELKYKFLDMLNQIANINCFFELVKMQWEKKLNIYENQGFKYIQEDWKYKQLSHIPSNIRELQVEILHLLNNTLDIISDDKSVQVKLEEYYKNKYFSGVSKYKFSTLYVDYENVDKEVFTEVLYPDNIYQIIEFVLRKCLIQEVRIRQCKNCGKYFELKNFINTEYCSRVYKDTGKTCKEIGANNVWLKKRNSDPILKLYSKEYKRHFAWIRYGKIEKEDFYTWSQQARQMRDKCIDGKITYDEFEEWLKNSI